jgi:endonuclease YncB( thermonuclease family)
LISVLGWTEVKDGTIVRPPVTPMGSVTVQVLRVLDGDTIDVKILDTKDPDLPASILHRWSAQELSLSPSLRVRLIGIDAPELFYESGELSHSGLESLNAVRDLIEDKKIELQFDAIYWDTYERILAYVLLLNSEELLQTTLLREGNAVAIREFYHPYRDYFVALEGEAELQKKGLWALRVEPTLFTSAEPMMSTRNNDAQSSSSQNFFPDRPAFSPISSSVHSYSAKKIFKQKPASVVLVSQTKVKWNVQSASSEQDHESGSSILSSGSLLASLNIVDVEEDKVTLLPSSVQFSFVAFFSHFFHTLLDALRALLA